MSKRDRFDGLDADELFGDEPVIVAAPLRRGARHRAPTPMSRLVRGLAVVAAVLTMAVAGGAWFLIDRYAGNVDRVPDVFADLPADERPAPASPAAGTTQTPVTFLLVGSNGESGQARADAIMLARLAGDREHVQVVSIPRSALVDIPDLGENRLDAAYSAGGPALLVRTVEGLTGVRIDHFASIDFAGLIAMTDQLGGVDITVPETTTEGPYTFTAGVNRLDGAMARAYVGPSARLPGGDLERVARQQNYLRSMFDTLFAAGTFSSVPQIDGVLRAVAGSVAVDDTLTDAGLLELALSTRGIEPGGIAFVTAPVAPTGTNDRTGITALDVEAGARLWGFLQTDSLAQHADEFGSA